MKTWRYTITIFALGYAMTAKAEQFNNDSVIALSSAGVGDSVLLAKINSLPCAYDVSTSEIVRIKQAGVSNEVIAAMVDRCVGSSRAQGTDDNSSDPLVKRTPGIYLYNSVNDHNYLNVIRPTNGSGIRITGNGSLVFPFVAKISIPQQSAQITPSGRIPVFYFYFEASDRRVGDFGTSDNAAAQSPSEFNLIRFKSTSSQREMTISRVSAFNTSIGIDPKNTIPFKIQEVGDGIFRVEMSSPLNPGEYAFVLRAGSDKYRIYDFKIQ